VRCGLLQRGSASRCMLVLVFGRCTNFTGGLGVGHQWARHGAGG
jgi:hypothetical protein